MVDTIVNKYHLYLESTQRTLGTNEDAYYYLRRPLFKSKPFNHFQVKVIQANIPYSFFNITNQNGNYNTMKWYLARGGASYPSTTYVYGSPSVPKTVTIPNGNYTILSLITAIKSGIIADLVVNYPAYSNPVFTWTYDRDTLQVLFTLTGTDNIVTTFYFLPSTENHGGLAYNMGIGSTINFGYDALNVSKPINNINNITTSGAYGGNAINVAPITSIMIRSNNLKQNRSFEFVAVTDDLSDILARVPISTVGTTFLQYINQENLSNRIKNDVIDYINLYITDNRDYDPIHLAGLSWMCVLEITEIEGHENRDNEAYQMLKNINFSNGELMRPFKKEI
jgi:hypothetical protein